MNTIFKPCIFILFTLVLIPKQKTQAQNTITDSLEQVLLTLPPDSSQVETLLLLGKKYRRPDPGLSMERFKSALQLAIQVGYYKGEASAAYNLGVNNGIKGKYPEALQYFKKTEKLSRQHQFGNLLSSANSGMGIVYKRIGDYPTSMSYYRINLHVADSINDIESQANCYSNLGVLYDLMKEPEKALAAYQKCLELNASIGIDATSSVDNNLGVLFLNEEKYDTAAQHFRRILSYQIKNNNQVGICNASNNLGHTLVQLNQLREAESILLKGLEVAEKHNFRQEKSNLYHNLGLLKIKQKAYAEALSFSNNALQIADSLGSFDLRKQNYQLKHRIYKAMGEHEMAYENMALFLAAKDSLFSRNKIREFERHQVSFEVYKKDKELKEQSLELQLLNTKMRLEYRLRWAFGILAGLLLILLVLILARFRTKNRVNKLLASKNSLISEQKEEIEAINEQLEKRMLRAQMNPHFIFNALSSIQHFITSNDRVSALKYLSKFSNLLRQVLESSINYQVLLSEEIQLLSIYLDLEGLRFEQQFDYSITVAKDLNPAEHEIPILLVQPYIENAVLHGLLPKQGSKKVSVHFEFNKGNIQCTIIDNGVGRAKAKKSRMDTKQPSRGMAVTAQRIHALNPERPTSELVQIIDLYQEAREPAGTKVIIQIPKT